MDTKPHDIKLNRKSYNFVFTVLSVVILVPFYLVVILVILPVGALLLPFIEWMDAITTKKAGKQEKELATICSRHYRELQDEPFHRDEVWAWITRDLLTRPEDTPWPTWKIYPRFPWRGEAVFVHSDVVIIRYCSYCRAEYRQWQEEQSKKVVPDWQFGLSPVELAAFEQAALLELQDMEQHLEQLN